MEIENYIKNNLRKMNPNELFNEIENSSNEEALPGLGVLFKIYYNSLNINEKKNLTSLILNHL